MNITENNRLKKQIIVKYFFKENCFSLFLLPAFIFLQNPDTNLHLIECNLNNILQNIFRKYRSIFIYKAVELRYTDCNLKIVGDPVLFEVMIEQLISNSLKYCGIDGKKGIITVYAEVRTPISLIIEDNGIGIAASYLPKIFDKGYSGLNSRLSEKTTGLGLYLAKTIAERLNCTISIDSAQNEWTKAVIKIMPAKVIRA